MTVCEGTSVGFVGAGAMGGSIARGLVGAGVLDVGRLLVADSDPARLAPFAELGARTYPDAASMLADGPDAVVLAVKPQVLGSVLSSVAPLVDDALVVSIAAGVTIASIEAALPGARVVRVMPNLPVQVRSGATAVCAGTHAGEKDVDLVLSLVSALGAAFVMREDQLDVAGAVSGCAPAFFSLLVDALTRAGVGAGLPAACAREMVESTMRGCAEQLLNEGVHPREYMERVTSPGGTTAAALRALEGPLTEGTYAAIDAALARTRELADG